MLSPSFLVAFAPAFVVVAAIILIVIVVRHGEDSADRRG